MRAVPAAPHPIRPAVAFGGTPRRRRRREGRSGDNGAVGDFFHVTASGNRDSILRHGLDWRRGGGGIAGSRAPEQEGIFLAREPIEVDFFVRMGKRRFGSLDVWAVTLEGVNPDDLDHVDGRFREFDGFLCWTEVIPPERLRLLDSDL
jgi:hypothetical protein